jgi:hypothetical protein
LIEKILLGFVLGILRYFENKTARKKSFEYDLMKDLLKRTEYVIQWKKIHRADKSYPLASLKLHNNAHIITSIDFDPHADTHDTTKNSTMHHQS